MTRSPIELSAGQLKKLLDPVKESKWNQILFWQKKAIGDNWWSFGSFALLAWHLY